MKPRRHAYRRLHLALVVPRDQLEFLLLVAIALYALHIVLVVQQHLRHRFLTLISPIRTHLTVERTHLVRQMLADLVRHVIQVARPAEHIQHVVRVRRADLLQIRHATHRKP